MRLILVLNGYEENYLKTHGFSQKDTKVIKFDEKKLASPSTVIKLINEGGYKEFYVASRELALQRFKTFIKFYVMISRATKGGVIDEYGASDLYTLPKLLLKDLPLLGLEIVISAIVVTYSYIKFPLMKWLLKKKT